MLAIFKTQQHWMNNEGKCMVHAPYVVVVNLDLDVTFTFVLNPLAKLGKPAIFAVAIFG